MTDGASEGCGQLPLADGHRVENGEQVPLHDGPLQRRHGVRSGRPLDEFTEERDGFPVHAAFEQEFEMRRIQQIWRNGFPFWSAGNEGGGKPIP